MVRSPASSEHSASSGEELRNAHTCTSQVAVTSILHSSQAAINIFLYLHYALYQALLVTTHIIMSDGAPVSSVSESSATQSSDSSNGSFAFYIHSQDTLNHGPPLHEDRIAFARQKRRRTRYGSSPIVTALRVSLVVTVNPPWHGLILKFRGSDHFISTSCVQC